MVRGCGARQWGAGIWAVTRPLPLVRPLGVALVLCQLLLLGLAPADALTSEPGSADPPLEQPTDLFAELRTFPGVVLVPPAGLAPFEALQPWRVEMTRPMPGSTAPFRGRYLVQYRDPQRKPGGAQVGGSMGREELEQTLAMLAGHSFTRCPEDAAYCVENVAGQDGAPPASEVFRGLSVNDGPAVVEHVVCCGGHYWSLTWYDATRDMTYVMVVDGPVADQYGATISADNRPVAVALGGVAAKLVPLE